MLLLDLQVESTIDQVLQASSDFLDSAQQIFQAVTEALKPTVPIVQRAGEEALKIASPVISEASKKAQEAMQSSGVDTEPVMTAAKVHPFTSCLCNPFDNIHFTGYL